MDENLVGYLLGALDPEAEREVEAYVRAQPEAARKLELLRQALEPLAADREPELPPPGLRIRTLARLAEYRCQNLPAAPLAPPIRSRSPGRSRWRRVDVLVAACLLLVLLPLIPPALTRLRAQRNIVECQNRLRSVYAALMDYSTLHDGALPRVEMEPPRHVAGIFVPILRDERLLRPEVNVDCPASGHPPPPQISVQDLEQLAAEHQRFLNCARQLAGCYAYTLGYRDASGNLCGARLDPTLPHNDVIPILADRPPFDQRNFRAVPVTTNSPNHDGTGQNVLYLSGHVRFCTQRTVGANGHDIYLNEENRPEAGRNRLDSVLGGSGFYPSLSLLDGD